MYRHGLIFLLLTAAAVLLSACAGAPAEQASPVCEIDGTPLGEFTILRTDKVNADNTAISKELQLLLRDSTGVSLPLATDWLERGAEAPPHEIFVGEVDRPEYAKANGGDCWSAYGVTDGKLWFDGGNAEGIRNAVSLFAGEYLGNPDGFSLESGFRRVYTYAYRLETEENNMEVLNTRESFVWGVNGHNRVYRAYPESTLDAQLRLAAELGSKVYRFNFNPESDADFAYLDKVLTLCERYGMDMMLVLDNDSGTPDEIYSRHLAVAERYKGRIKYYQLFNETDVAAMHNDDGTLYHAGDGSTLADFNPDKVAALSAKLKRSSEAFRKGDPDAKLVINFAWKHWGILGAYREAGVDWDIIGVDWYSDMENAWSITGLLDTLARDFREYSYIICECDIWAHDVYTEEQQADYMTKFAKKVYAYKNERLLGMIVYELLDQLSLEGDKYEGEAHFGLVNCDSGGKIGEVKAAYSALQKLWLGGKTSVVLDSTPVN